MSNEIQVLQLPAGHFVCIGHYLVTLSKRPNIVESPTELALVHYLQRLLSK